MRRDGVAQRWVGPGADAGRAGQGAVGPCREVGVEGATDRVKRLVPRRFSARLGVACVAVGNRDLVGSTFPFTSVDFLHSYRLLCDASVSQGLH